MKKITVIGLGGVGGYFGFKLAEHFADQSTASIGFVVREPAFSVIKENGLTLISPEHQNKPHAYPASVYPKLSETQPADLYLICVKEYDLEAICDQLRPLVKDHTVIIPLMNGADIYERIRQIIPNGLILPSCVYVASHIKEKGTVEHKGKPGTIICGKDPVHPDFNPEYLISLLKSAGISITLEEDALPAIWTKFFFISSFGLVTALYDKPIGYVLADVKFKALAESIMEEILLIAKYKKINLSEDIILKTFRKAGQFPFETPTSLQLDINNKRNNTELEIFAGSIINYAEEYSIEVPHTKHIYALIKDKIK